MADQKKSETRVPTAIRILPELKRALERLAQDDGRTFSAYVERVLSAHVAAVPKPRKK